QLLLTAGPSRMRLRVDVEVQRVALLAPRAAGGELGAVGHHHLDGVIVRMQVGFHGRSSCAARATIRQWKVAALERSPPRETSRSPRTRRPDCHPRSAGALSRRLRLRAKFRMAD